VIPDIPVGSLPCSNEGILFPRFPPAARVTPPRVLPSPVEAPLSLPFLSSAAIDVSSHQGGGAPPPTLLGAPSGPRRFWWWTTTT